MYSFPLPSVRGPVPVDRPWLRWYDQGVPASVPVPPVTLPDLLAGSARRCPERPAIRFYGRAVSYRDLNDAVDRFAAALIALGIRKGDRVSVLLPNCPQFVIALYGGLRAGAVMVPTNPLSAPDELRTVWSDAGISAAVCLSSFYSAVDAIRGDLPTLRHVIVAHIKDYLPPVKRFLFTLARERKEGHRVRLPRDGRTSRFSDLLVTAHEIGPLEDLAPDDLALLQPTGGTTGTSKLAMLSHRNLVANGAQTRAWVSSVAAPGGEDVVLGVVPLFHIYGMTTVLTYSMLAGATMLLHPRFVRQDVLRAIHDDRPDFFPGVPAMYGAIAEAPHLHRYDLTSLRAAISGAAPLPHAVQTEFERLTDAHLVEGYGLTEASPVTHCNPLVGTRRVGSIGVPLPGTDAVVVDAERGTRSLPPGEVGELAVRGPQVMRGYWRRENETRRTLRDGWLLTGDLATVDSDGFFSIVDRKKDMIISGGLNVYPREVEEPLYAHPKVAKAVAVGLPDPRWGEAVKVYIVLREGETATQQDIIDYCRLKMARYKVPKMVEFRESLPENLIGKVLRRRLLEEEASTRELQRV